MDKWMMRIASLFVAVILITGCTPKNDDSTSKEPLTESAVEEVITVTISKDKGEEIITEKELSIKEGDLLLDLMKENFDIEEDGGLITSIDGLEQDVEASIGWMYFVNDEMAMVGAAEFELSVGDRVNFDLQSWK